MSQNANLEVASGDDRSRHKDPGHHAERGTSPALTNVARHGRSSAGHGRAVVVHGRPSHRSPAHAGKSAPERRGDLDSFAGASLKILQCRDFISDIFKEVDQKLENLQLPVA